MKLRNRKTGEIIEFDAILPVKDVSGDSVAHLEYDSLTELNAEWEDVPEEPKEHWCVTMYGGITRIKDDEEPIDDLIEIGNYFNSKEDAYDAWDKLKAWKRLKDKGFRFIEGYLDNNDDFIIKAKLGHVGLIDQSDVHLLFGGEE